MPMHETTNPAPPTHEPVYGPMTPAQLLTRSFALYRERPRVVFGLVGIVAAVQVIAIGVMAAPLAAVRHVTGGANPMQFILPVMGTALLAVLLIFLVSQVIQGAYFYAVTAWLEQREISIGDACSAALVRIGSLVSVAFQVALRIFGYTILAGIGVALLVGIPIALIPGLFSGASHGAQPLMIALRLIPFILLGCVAFLAFLFWLVGRYAISIPACLAEGLSGAAAIRRSIALSAKSKGRIYAMYAVLIAISILNLLIAAPLRLLAMSRGAYSPMASLLGAVASAANLFFGAWVISLAGIAITLCYYDLRVRKEGFGAPQNSPAAATAIVPPGNAPAADPSYDI